MIVIAWESEAPARRKGDFSDWGDGNRGNGSSRHRKNEEDNSSDLR